MLGSPDCANNSWLASSAFSSFIRWNKSFTILCSSFRLMKPSLLMSNTLKICFKFSCGVPLDMMYSTIMNSLKLEFPNFDIDTFGIYLEYNTQRRPLLRCQSLKVEERPWSQCGRPCWCHTSWRCASPASRCRCPGSTRSSSRGMTSEIFGRQGASSGNSGIVSAIKFINSKSSLSFRRSLVFAFAKFIVMLKS